MDCADEVLVRAITCGGVRKHALLSMLCAEGLWNHAVAAKAFGPLTPQPIPGFDLRFSAGVEGEPLRTRAQIEKSCGDVLDLIGFDEEQRATFTRLASLARPENRKVLGCLLANIRAMNAATENEATSRRSLIVEDNVRFLTAGAAAGVRAALDAATDTGVDLVFLGYLAHDDTLQNIVAKSVRGRADGAVLIDPAVDETGGEASPVSPETVLALLREFCTSHPGSDFVSASEFKLFLLKHAPLFSHSGKGWRSYLESLRPFVQTRLSGSHANELQVRNVPAAAGPIHTTVVKKNHELWGTFAYSITRRLFTELCTEIRQQFPQSIFRPCKRDCRVVPIDKLIQRCSHRATLSVRVAATPTCFRMPPTLASKIHPKWDKAYFRSTSLQLRSLALAWSDIWLLPSEQEAAQRLSSQPNPLVESTAVTVAHALALCEVGDYSKLETELEGLGAANGLSLFHLAARDGRLNAARYLIETHGSDVDDPDSFGLTALHHAAYRGHLAMVRLLVDEGANTGSRTAAGCTPFLAACSKGHADVCEFMLSASADPRAVDFAGNSACHLAARNGHSSVLQLLDAQLQDASTSQFELLNNDGLSALELARIRQRASALSFLGDMQARLAATQSSCHSIQVCHDAEPQA